LKAQLTRSVREPFVIAHEETAIRPLFAPNQSGCKVQSVSRAKAKTFQLHVSLFADFLIRLDLAPRREQLKKPVFGRAVGTGAKPLFKSQAFQRASDFYRGQPPDHGSLLA